MSAQLATASPRRIKASHRRRWKAATGHRPYANNNPYRFTDPDGRRSKEEADHKREIAEAQQAHRQGVASREALQPVIPEAILLPAVAVVKTFAMVAEVAAPISKGPETAKGPEFTKPYERPSGTPTAAQRESVQGKPCVDCGATTARQVADHIVPLVKEYYQTGRIDMEKAKSLDSVQPQCPTCSARQGAEMSRYSRAMKEEHGL